MKPNERLQMAMSAKYGTTSPTLVARKLSNATKIPISRQNVSNWLKPTAKFLEPQLLFPVADALSVSARWLCAVDKTSQERVRSLSIREAAVLDILEAMSDEAAATWLEQGRAFVSLSPATEKASR